MPKPTLALKNEFRSLMEARRAWPLIKEMRNRIEGGIRTETIRAMKDGAVVPERCVRALALLLQGTPPLDDYLASIGLPESRVLDTGKIMDAIASAEARDAPAGRDWLMSGLDGLNRTLTDYLFGKEILPAGTICHDETDVKAACLLMMGSVGYRLQKGRKKFTVDEAICRAEQHMTTRYRDYEVQHLALWQAVPWSVVFAVADGERAGCSCILPLSRTAYQSFRRGERCTHTATPDDLAFPSRYLLMESIGEASAPGGPSTAKRTRQMIRAICLQLAILSLFEDREQRHLEQRLRILSFGGTPLNQQRLRRYGFRPNQFRMAVTNVPMMELDRRRGWLFLDVLKLMRKRLRKFGFEHSLESE